MIRLSVLYPKTDGAKFDHDYYRDQHVPLAVSTWGVERVEIDKGVNGPYEAAVHFFFPSTDAIGVAMGSGSEVTKQAGRMILTDDNFGTLVHAVEIGRRVYDKVVAYVRYQMTQLLGLVMLFLAASAAISPSSRCTTCNASFQRRSNSLATNRLSGSTASYCRRAYAAEKRACCSAISSCLCAADVSLV